MGEEAITSGRQKALREAMILLDLAITRSGGQPSQCRTKEPVRGAGKRPIKSLATHDAVWRCKR
jgi:hypothetical protein